MNNAKILLVEDDSGVRDLLVDVLEGDGIAVAVAANGKEGLRALEGNSGCSAVLSDIAMPEMDGLDLLMKVRERGMEIPFVLFSGVIDKEQLLRAHQLGVFGVLEKPSSPARILDAVRGAVEYGHLMATITEELQRIFRQYGVPEAERQKLLGLERALTRQRAMGQFLHLP